MFFKVTSPVYLVQILFQNLFGESCSHNELPDIFIMSIPAGVLRQRAIQQQLPALCPSTPTWSG